MKVKKFYLLLFFIASSSVFAHFDDAIISPFLGPYKISQISIGNCPNTLLLMAQCTLERLDLKNSENPDFDFLSFKGINAGEMITTINGQIIEKNLTTFEKLTIISIRETYFSRYKAWFKEKTELTLNGKKFVFKKLKEDLKTKKDVTELQCEYAFDEIENKKTLDALSSQKTK